MKFKNVRRPPRAAKAGILVEPQAKRFKSGRVDDDDGGGGNTSGMDKHDEYDKNVQYLKKLWNSKKWFLAVVMELVEQTATSRRKWILEGCPLISEVLVSFPCFADPRIVSNLLFIIKYVI